MWIQSIKHEFDWKTNNVWRADSERVKKKGRRRMKQQKKRKKRRSHANSYHHRIHHFTCSDTFPFWWRAKSRRRKTDNRRHQQNPIAPKKNNSKTYKLFLLQKENQFNFIYWICSHTPTIVDYFTIVYPFLLKIECLCVCVFVLWRNKIK